MDNREARGRALAQSGRVRPVEGPLWFVPSESAGGWIVDAEAGRCQCPDAARGAQCKHLIAVAAVRDAPPKPEAPKVLPRCDLSVEEQANIRAALRFLGARVGGMPQLAKRLRVNDGSLYAVAGRRKATASLAVRLAKFAGVPVDDVICGRFPPPGACPHCGHCPPA